MRKIKGERGAIKRRPAKRMARKKSHSLIEAVAEVATAALVFYNTVKPFLEKIKPAVAKKAAQRLKRGKKGGEK